MSLETLAANTPVLIGIGTAIQRIQDPREGLSALQLMQRAAEQAAADCKQPTIWKKLDSIWVPKGIWSYSDPGRQIARELGAPAARSVLGNIGILQQSLFNQACQAIHNGEQQLALVCGGEAKYRDSLAQRQGVELNDVIDQDSEPDVFLTISDDIVSPVELERGMAMPASAYAVMESAMRYQAGLSIEAHRASLGELYAGFSRIAASNPDAWDQTAYSAEDIYQVSARNRMVAFPYTKRMNSQWNVDQASALLFASAGLVRELGIAEELCLFPWCCTESEYMTLVSERSQLHRCVGAGVAGHKALDLIDASIEDIEFLELYSCFPAAVKSYVQELGVAPTRPLVISGGMSFAGGPLNNFVLQSTVAMARTLRANPGSRGLVSSVSGMLTKQAFAIWSSKPPAAGYQHADVSAETASLTDTSPLQPDYQGSAKVAGYTINCVPGFPEHLVTVCDLPTGGRTVATSLDDQLLGFAKENELCGRAVAIDSQHTVTLQP